MCCLYPEHPDGATDRISKFQVERHGCNFRRKIATNGRQVTLSSTPRSRGFELFTGFSSTVPSVQSFSHSIHRPVIRPGPAAARPTNADARSDAASNLPSNSIQTRSGLLTRHCFFSTRACHWCAKHRVVLGPPSTALVPHAANRLSREAVGRVECSAPSRHAVASPSSDVTIGR